MDAPQDFLGRFMFTGGLMQLSFDPPWMEKWYPEAPAFSNDVPSDKNVYFSPALRSGYGSLKEHVAGTHYLWVDSDDPVMPEPTFPPSIIVSSGHGYHLYWRISEPLTDIEAIEIYNKILIADVPTADPGCWNANRLLRVPGTYNAKPNMDPVLASIQHVTNITYDSHDFLTLAQLDDATRHKIRTGAQASYRSRSERDWAVVCALVNAGATDKLIELLFENAEVGDKYRNEKTPEHYLTHTIAKSREEMIAQTPITLGGMGTKPKKERKGTQTNPVTIVEKEDGYYMVGTTSRRVSTFTLQPVVLLDGSVFDKPDMIVCNVHAGGFIWDSVIFGRDAFSSVSKMDTYCKYGQWQWLGHDADIRLLLPYIMQKLKEAGFPKVAASPTLGLHIIRDRLLFLTDTQTIAADAVWNGIDAPLTWMPTNREHPSLHLGMDVTEAQLAKLAELLPRLNEPCTIWGMIGWYAASCLKPWLETNHYRFPILDITGTKGSGKTTLMQRVLMPLFGQIDAKPYDAGTTKFVQLALLGASNAVPVAFSEFRFDAVEKFNRTILLAYDTGHDPRGRADQTTQDYPLSAPFSVDGEDVINDAAGRERIVLARLRPATIIEGGDAYQAFREIRTFISDELGSNFAGYYIQRCLTEVVTGNADRMLHEAREELFSAFPGHVPDRIRNNYTVALFGIKLFCRAVGMQAPTADIFRPSIGELVNLDSGLSRTLIDEFAESLVNAMKHQGGQGFHWRYESKDQVAYFQMSSTHSWWLGQRRKQGRSAMERDAIINQLREATYYVPAKTVDNTWMYGISLPRAQEAGLDVPSKLNSNTITLNM